jgi:sulfate-transporting ATPase
MSQIPIFLLLSLPLVAAFSMFSLGIVVIHQSSRVLNLAHGAMAMVPAYVMFELSNRGVPLVPALLLAIASGALLGAFVERFFVRPLGKQSATAQTVGTVAVLGLLVAIAVKVWGTTPRVAIEVFPHGGIGVGSSLLRYGQIGLLGVAAVATAGLFAVFRYTAIGLAMRGVAENRRAAALVGVDPDATTRIAWMIGGALAATAGVFLAPVTTLHPYNLSLLVLPGFVAALIGGLGSLPGALAGAAIVGVVEGMVPALGLVPGVGAFASQVGASQVVLTVLAFVVMFVRGQRFTGAVASSEQRAPASVPAVSLDRARSPLGVVGKVLIAAAALLWPLFGSTFSLLGDAIQAAVLTIVAVSVVFLTGWVAQISLSQAAFVGIGAFSTGVLARKAGIPFPLSLPIAAAIAGAAAGLLGVVALRVRGLYLAVATLIFLWMSNEYLFHTSWLVGPGGSSSIPLQHAGTRGRVPYFDFSNRTTFYYVALAAAAAVLWGAANLRDSKTGRALFAIRGSEIAAASLGIDVTRYKLFAFAVSGVLAGVAGNLLMVNQGVASSTQFGFAVSLFFLAVPVVGGLTRLGGAVAASMVFAALNEVFFRVPALAGWLDVVSAGLLAVVLLAYPQGLAGLAVPVSRAFAFVASRRPRAFDDALEAIGRRLSSLASPLRRARRAAAPAELARFIVEAPAHANGNGNGVHAPALPPDRADRTPVLEADGITVRFGGLAAVEGFSLSVRRGEIVGLIGPNGAGKTTLFNAISGLNVPTHGTVHLFGTDVTSWPVHRRAELGVARTFQLIQLFSELTVFENLLVATHLQNKPGAISHLLVTRSALAAEEVALARVREVLRLLDLEDIADRPVAGLPFGTLRMIEVARAVVTNAPLMMLDEPASGLDNAETERLGSLLLRVRAAFGVSLLLIEHDVRMVTSVSDYIYVINRGRPLAEGVPAEVQRDDRVVAAYLGASPA